MALIDKNSIKYADISGWPNPYNLTEKDAKDRLEGYPLEIITLILKEMELQGRTNCLSRAQTVGISSSHVLDWDKTKDGPKFWSDIRYMNRFDVFYDKYTPHKLQERIKER